MEGLGLHRHETDRHPRDDGHEHSAFVDNVIDGVHEIERAAAPEPQPEEIEEKEERSTE